MKTKVKKGQLWKSKESSKIVRVSTKASGNRHWTLDNGHHIHEGTLQKFYELVSFTRDK